MSIDTDQARNPDAGMPQDASAATDRDSWLALIDVIGEEAGYFQTLGAHHWAYFSDQSPTLLVTFETVDAIRMGSASQLPLGHGIAAAKGWSHLCIIADGPTWWRDLAVYRYFDRLVDDAFFEDFDRVVFYGAGAGGYAACAYSVTAPGATVVAVQPRATLDPSVASWDKRHLKHRRLNFTDRYGYAPDMIEGTGDVFVIFDPTQTADAMHAALFTKPFVTMLHTPHLGERVDAALQAMGVLPAVIEAACEGTLTPARFATEWRKRRGFGPYLKTMLAKSEATGHPMRAAWVCRSVTKRLNAPRFRKRLAELEAERAT
ncbi:MAG: phosphoadenosine phosphosulfate reductase [Paracoccaceae bacterium]